MNKSNQIRLNLYGSELDLECPIILLYIDTNFSVIFLTAHRLFRRTCNAIPNWTNKITN